MRKPKVDVARTVLALGFVVILVFCAVTETSLMSAVAVLAALVAGFVALSINETVAARRRAELAAKVREQREAAYRQILEHMLQLFQGGPERSEWHVRPQIAVWASASFLESYSQWRAVVNRLTRHNHRVVVLPEQKWEVQEAIAKVCQQARRDLGIDDGAPLPVSAVARVFFDDYDDPNVT